MLFSRYLRGSDRGLRSGSLQRSPGLQLAETLPASISEPGSNDIGQKPKRFMRSAILDAAEEGEEALETLLELRADRRFAVALTIALLSSLLLLLGVALNPNPLGRSADVARNEAVGLDW